MAAIDPNAPPELNGTANSASQPRATLKIIYDPTGPMEDDDSDKEKDDNYLQALLEGDEDESSSDEEEKNGGPSDPSKTKKARKQAAAEQMMKALAENESDNDEMDVDASSKSNGILSKKGKGKSKAIDEEDEDGNEDDGESLDGMDELVLCTLDPAQVCPPFLYQSWNILNLTLEYQNYQQPLDLTISEDQRAFFKVSGTHAIYLTGNYVIAADDGHNHKHEVYGEDGEDYDLSPDEDELDDEEESDELDDLEDPRITELGSEDDEPPKLIKKDESTSKSKKKRAADDSEEETANLDQIMAKALKPVEPSTNGEAKLSKKQIKKLKNNAGKAVEASAENKDVKKANAPVKDSPNGKAVEAAVENKEVKKANAPVKDSPNGKVDKKVQFAKNLEQGPTGGTKETKADSKTDVKGESKNEDEKPKASLGPKTVQGVLIDDRKLGKGPAAKKGSKVGMRYIGKLEDGKVFDGTSLNNPSPFHPLILIANGKFVFKSANKKGAPFTFNLGAGEVIKGWDIGVTGMSIGGERRITVPAHLGYGSKSMPGIPANSKLIFDVKLLTMK